MPEDLAPFYTAGRGGPGLYLLNTYDLPSRPLYNLTALTLHESAPGHAFQIPIALEHKDQPEFRQHTYLSAYGEGWALYCERLGAEMGMYETAYDRFGMLGYQIWRAARLVVDTGVHAQGWTRSQAIAYLRQYTALPEHEIETEVDRYIAWPAQALSYYLGERAILQARARAEQALGDRFNIRAFHDAVLELGSVPLPVVQSARAPIRTWSEGSASARRGRVHSLLRFKRMTVRTGAQSLKSAPPHGLPPVMMLADHFGYPGGVPHGVTSYLLNVLPALRAAGIDLTVCFLREPHEAANALREHGIDPVFFAASKWDPFVALRIARLARRRGVSLLHSTGLKCTFMARIAARLAGACNVLHVHDLNEPGRLLSGLQSLFARCNDFGVCVSEAARDLTVHRYHVAEDRVRVIHNGIRVQEIAEVEPGSRARVRHELALSPDEPVVAMIGRMYRVTKDEIGA